MGCQVIGASRECGYTCVPMRKRQRLLPRTQNGSHLYVILEREVGYSAGKGRRRGVGACCPPRGMKSQSKSCKIIAFIRWVVYPVLH